MQMGGPTTSLEAWWRVKSLPLSRIKTLAIQPSDYTDWALPAPSTGENNHWKLHWSANMIAEPTVFTWISAFQHLCSVKSNQQTIKVTGTAMKLIHWSPTWYGICEPEVAVSPICMSFRPHGDEVSLLLVGVVLLFLPLPTLGLWGDCGGEERSMTSAPEL